MNMLFVLSLGFDRPGPSVHLLTDLMEALAVMIVTSCIIPILVLMFMLWIVKVLLALDINLPSLPLRHPAGTDDTN